MTIELSFRCKSMRITLLAWPEPEQLHCERVVYRVYVPSGLTCSHKSPSELSNRPGYLSHYLIALSNRVRSITESSDSKSVLLSDAPNRLLLRSTPSAGVWPGAQSAQLRTIANVNFANYFGRSLCFSSLFTSSLSLLSLALLFILCASSKDAFSSRLRSSLLRFFSFNFGISRFTCPPRGLLSRSPRAPLAVTHSFIEKKRLINS